MGGGRGGGRQDRAQCLARVTEEGSAPVLAGKPGSVDLLDIVRGLLSQPMVLRMSLSEQGLPLVFPFILSPPCSFFLHGNPHIRYVLLLPGNLSAIYLDTPLLSRVPPTNLPPIYSRPCHIHSSLIYLSTSSVLLCLLGPSLPFLLSMLSLFFPTTHHPFTLHYLFTSLPNHL